MTTRKTTKCKTWQLDAAAERAAEADGGPSYIAILPRHGVYLFCSAGDGQRFARLFRQTWRKLPLWARRRLLKHWRSVRRERYGDAPLFAPWPPVELVDLKSNLYRGNSHDAIAQYDHMHCNFAFVAGTMDALPEYAVEAVIAHELAHAVLSILDVDHHLSPANVQYDSMGFSQAEAEADELAEGWGFDMEGRAKALIELDEADRKEEDARDQ